MMKKRSQQKSSIVRTMFFALISLIFFGFVGFAGLANSTEQFASVKVNKLSLKLELAVSASERRVGLQNRTELCASCGMIFKFTPARSVSMWMKDTLIPLDIAFVDSNGVIFPKQTEHLLQMLRQ